MIRKRLVKIIACFFAAQGLWDIVSFLLPIFTSPEHATLNLATVIAGVLGLWAGIYLFRMDEFGRKFAIALLSLRVVYNLSFIIWAAFQKDLSFAINYFDKPLFKPISIYVFAISLTVWAGIALGAILFLRQRETKIMFVPETASEKGSEPITKSIL